MTPPAPQGTTPLGSGAGQQLLSAEKSHFATHVDITVKTIVEFQNVKQNLAFSNFRWANENLNPFLLSKTSHSTMNNSDNLTITKAIKIYETGR